MVESNPYPCITLKKAKCVGHVQKGVGNRLRDIRDNYRGVIVEIAGNNYVGIGGAGRLTEKATNALQNYYGMVIRDSQELYSMKKAVAAVVHHYSFAKTPADRHKC